jgi:hypothetical protein
MLKTDVSLFNDLTSADDALRLAAATKLEQRPAEHFKDHPVRQFMYEPAQIQSLLEAWKSTRGDLVKAWIAQALALTETETGFPPGRWGGEVLSLMADSLKRKLNGPYMGRVAQHVYRYSERIPNGNDFLRGLCDHSNHEVRWRCAMALGSFVVVKKLVAGDLALVRRLMLDTNATVRNEAVLAAKRIAEEIPGFLGPEDYEVLLDVENIDSGAARTYARELMVKLEASVPGCRREAFAPRVPVLRTESECLYGANRGELDAVGRWMNRVYLRFFPDGTVHVFGTDEHPVDFLKRLPEGQEYIARGTFAKDGARLSFSCAGYEGHWSCEGHIDADQLHLRGVHAESGRRVENVPRLFNAYCLLYLNEAYRNWEVMPVPQAVKPMAKKGGLPFIPLRPQSMTFAGAEGWYRQMVMRLPLLLATTPEDSRLMAAWETRRRLRDTAARALGDQGLKKEFLTVMPLPSLEEWKTRYGDNALRELCKLSQEDIDRYIGPQCWDGNETWWVMTEQGWRRRGESKQ